MFDIGGGELLVIGIVALVVIGPKELPGLIRTAGNAMAKVRRMAAEFRGQFDEAMREAELDQAKKAFNDINDTARSATTAFNPLETIRNEIKSVKDEIKTATTVTETPPTAPLPEPKLPPPPEPAPLNLTATPPLASEPAAEPQPEKPKRSRKKPAAETPGSAA
jgi:sec-independent protein translocase protein TatB